MMALDKVGEKIAAVKAAANLRHVMKEFGRGSPTQVVPGPFDLAGIKPPHGEMDGRGKFSPNLYRWLKKQADRCGGEYHLNRFQIYRGGSDLFARPRDVLYIGYIGNDGWFHGTRLMAVLCEGARKQIFAYMPGHVRKLGLKPVRNFWRDYRRIGRCAIDKAHTQYFAHAASDDARWTVKGKTRSCNWCGNHKQRLSVRTETKRTVVKTWVPANG